MATMGLSYTKNAKNGLAFLGITYLLLVHGSMYLQVYECAEQC